MSSSTSELMESARQLLKKLKKMGHEAYIVGGTVRDFLLNTDIHDVDIATNCPMEELRSKFRTHEITKKIEFEHVNFGVLLVAFQGNMFEVAQFRTEKGYDGRHPSEVSFVQSLEEDVKRRDFTINAMAMDENDGIIDLVGGREDLKNKIIRAVGDPELRFTEDYLRMIRAARFAAKEGFRIDKATANAISKLSENIIKVSASRISGEITKASSLSSAEFASFILTLTYLGILYHILPEIEKLRYLKHNPKFHPEGITVFDHVIETIRAATDSDPAASIVRIGSLLHDVGKSTTFTDEGGLPHYYGHEKAGGEQAESILKRLQFPTSITEPVLFAVSHHMMFTHIKEMRPGKVARLVSHPHFSILAEVARADSKSRGADWHNDEEFDVLLHGLHLIRAKWEKFLGEKPLNLVDGHRILELTGLIPSRAIGEIKREAEERIIERSIDPNNLSAVDKVILEVYHEISKPAEGSIS